jgi:hypothetical protein
VSYEQNVPEKCDVLKYSLISDKLQVLLLLNNRSTSIYSIYDVCVRVHALGLPSIPRCRPFFIILCSYNVFQWHRNIIDIHNLQKIMISFFILTLSVVKKNIIKTKFGKTNCLKSNEWIPNVLVPMTSLCRFPSGTNAKRKTIIINYYYRRVPNSIINYHYLVVVLWCYSL